ncbi:MAG: TRAP transporter large permease, partial [Gammaproteobacteria bacterium]
PELRKRGYDERMIIGSIAGSGTLGLLIPPSIVLIVYGVATEESIGRLFVGGVIPGLLVMALYMAYIAGWALLHRRTMPPPEPRVSLAERMRASRRLIPVALLIAGVIGSIYAGLASPTDAAAVGVGLSLLIAWLSGDLNRETFTAGLYGAMVTSCMIAFILAGASFLTAAMGYAGLPRQLAAWIGALGLSPYQLLAALTVFFIVLGCFLDGISIVVLTVAIILPMVEAAGIDRIWFGIYLVLVVEMAQITPPVGFNLFVLQGLTGRNIFWIAGAAFPFFMLLVVAVALVAVFPGIVTWLPQTMFAGGA